MVVRGQKVLLDEQLAAFYAVPTKAMVQGVKRNIGRFPEDFAFQLMGDEWGVLRSQLAASNLRCSRSRCETLENKAFLDVSPPIFPGFGGPPGKNRLKTRGFTP